MRRHLRSLAVAIGISAPVFAIVLLAPRAHPNPSEPSLPVNRLVAAPGQTSIAIDSPFTFTLGSDTTGDLYYRGSSGFLVRLGIGSTGQALVVSSGGLPIWGTATGGGSGTPGGSSGQLQYNNAGAFAGATVGTGLNFSGGTLTVNSFLGTMVGDGYVPVSSGGSGTAAGFTADSPLFAGSSGLGAYQSISIGTANQVLTSNGPGALASFQSPNANNILAGLLGPEYGGTGVNNGSNTITLGGNLVMSGASATTFNVTGTTNLTLPTSGTLLTTTGSGGSLTGLNASALSSGTIPLGVLGSFLGTAESAGHWSVSSGGTGITGATAYCPIFGGTSSTGNFQVGAIGTANQVLTSNGPGSIAAFQTPNASWIGAGVLSPTYGGTGENNGSNILILAGNLVTSGPFNVEFTLTGSTSITLPTSGTLLATTGSGASLTSLNASQLTSGTVPTAQLGSFLGTGITNSGWAASQIVSGQLAVANGGTGASTSTAYAPIFGGTTSTGAHQSGTVGTANQALTSNGAGAIATFQTPSASWIGAGQLSTAYGGTGGTSYSSVSLQGTAGGTTLSPATSTYTKLTGWDTPEWDTDSAWSGANQRYTPILNGRTGPLHFIVTATVFSPNSGWTFQLWLYKNGAQYKLLSSQVYSGVATGSCVALANGSTDYFELYCWQNSGSAQSVYITLKDSHWSMNLIPTN